MNKLCVNSEIGKLKTVLLHRPGEELDNLTPTNLEDLLFDDIPWLPLAQKEHDAFKEAFEKQGVKVVYLVDLMKEVLDSSMIAKAEFIKQFVYEADIPSETLNELVTDYLLKIEDNARLVRVTMAGIKKTDIGSFKNRTLSDYIGGHEFITYPMPNLYFTRDPFAVIGNGVSLNKMYSKTRSRETIYGEYIFKYHPKYKNPQYFYNRNEKVSIEGGDIMVLNKKTLIVGISQRTEPGAVEKLAKNLFYNTKTEYETVLAFTIPKIRTFMHLDTIFTQIDKNKFTIHKECYDTLKIFSLTRDEENDGKLKVEEIKDKLEVVLEKYTGYKTILIPCGGDDSISASREQWSDGSNTICISPGKVIAYERNDITNKILESYNISVYTIPSSELSRGRGGPRCMCMPLEREEVEE